MSSGKLFSIVIALIGTVKCQKVYNQSFTTYSCQPGGPTPTLSTQLEVAYNTPGCVMPDCCGLISGTLSNISFTYQATQNVQGGTVSAVLTAVSGLTLPVGVEVPVIIASVNSDMCYGGPDVPKNPNVCPQIAGNIYTYTTPFTFPTPVLTTASLILEGKMQLTDGQTVILCAIFKAKIVSPALTQLPLVGNLLG